MSIYKTIYLYETIENWNNASPDVTIKGDIIEKRDTYIVIRDEENLIQYVNISKFTSIVIESE